MLADPPRKMPVLILAEPFSAPQVAPSFLHLLLCTHLASATSVKRACHQDPLSFMGPQGAHTAHTEQSPVSKLTACLRKHREKQEREDCPYLPNMSTTVRASQNNKVIALSFSFPWAIGKWCQIQEYQAGKGRGCQLSSANRELGTGSNAVTAAEGKAKIPQPLLVLLSSQTPHEAASSVLEKQSNICRWGSHVLVTILRYRMKPTFQYGKNRPVTSCQVLKLKRKKGWHLS